MDKEKITQENLDIARLAFGAYQSYGEKLARVEVAIYKDGTSVDEVYGQVNPCKFGDQCEGHACYCNNPRAYRKCHCSWYYGQKELDSKCDFYEPNPYWQEGDGDFYEQRDATLRHMNSLGQVEIEFRKINREPHEFYKGRKSAFYEIFYKEKKDGS